MPFEFLHIDPIIRTKDDAEAAKRRAIVLPFGFCEPGYLARFGAWDISHTADGAEIGLYAEPGQLCGLGSRNYSLAFTLTVSRGARLLNWFDVSKVIRLFGIPNGCRWNLLNDAISFQWSNLP